MNKKFENEINIIQKYFRHLYDQDPIMNQIGSFKILHGGGHRYEVEGKSVNSPIRGVSTDVTYKYDDIIDFKLEDFCLKLYDMVIERIGQMQKMMYSELISTTELTGNKVDAKGESIGPELILNMLEKN